MFLFQNPRSRLVFNQVNPGNTGGGGSNETPPAQNNTPPQTQGNFDQFGYPIQPSTPPPAPTQNTQGQAAQQASAQAAAAAGVGYDTPPPPPDKTGYGIGEATDKPAAPPASEAKPAVEPPKPGEFKLEVDMKDLSEADQKSLASIMEKHKLPKDAQESLVNLKKAEIAQSNQQKAEQEKQYQAQILKTKTEWFNELKNDKDFGGANFDANVKLVNKFVTDFMPNTKKMLTEKGGMLPPSTMRDFHSVAKKLYETEGFVQGDSSGASETKQPGKWNFLNDLYQSNV